ncbi:fungal-specific transcription factor domain-containing protein [Xylariaceae sp. FL0804]|nr:fungal-specific transcription factor domain-containing protein [Xylariaceae sp. FL0804]
MHRAQPACGGAPDHHHHHHQHQQQQQLSPLDGSGHSRADADSGDEGQPLHSGDENDDDQDLDSPGAPRSGKRKRPISVSCETCKQRKVKCDRGQPACGWCRRNAVFCEYRERKKPGLRAGYGRELEQRLDRLEEILKSHDEMLRDSFAGHGPHHVAASVRNSNASLSSDHGTPREPAPLFRAADALRTPQAETALFLQKPSAFPPSTQSLEFGLPPPTPSLSLHSAHETTFQPLPALQPVVAAAAASQEYYAPPQQAPAPASALRSPGLGLAQPSQTQISSDQDLPPYDLLYALADLYFKHINTWCPILHRKATLDSLFGPSTLDEADKILLHAIVATTLRYSTDARLTEERRRHYHDVSKQKVLLYGMENSSVKALQALVILALDLCGSSHGPPGWNIMALITRSVVQLGLAVESNSLSVSPNVASIYTLRALILPEPRDFVEEEARRRLFWMVYLLDRYATISTAFDFALDDKEIDRTLPCRDDLWVRNQKVETRWFRTEPTQTLQAQAQAQPPPSAAAGPGTLMPDHALVDRPENLGAFSYYIEILGILSKIHLFLKQPVDIGALGDVEQWQLRYKQLDNLLASWKFGLPGEYGNMAKLFQPGSARSLSAGWVMLHATYHTAVIRLHSSAAYPTTRSPIFTPSYSASQRCHAAVEAVTALGDSSGGGGSGGGGGGGGGLLTRLGPPFAFTLWVAARLLLVHGSTVEHRLATPNIAFLVDTLRDMGRHWPVAARYCQLLQRVLDEHGDSERAFAAAQQQQQQQGRHGQGQQQGQHQGQKEGEQRVTPNSVRILADMRRTAFDLDLLISRQPRHNSTVLGGAGVGAGIGAGSGGCGGGGGGPGGGPNNPNNSSSSSISRLPSATPASRTPAPNELEYLDVFDFFNVPRLPFAQGPDGNGGGGASDVAAGTGAVGTGTGDDPSGADGGVGNAGGVGGGSAGGAIAPNEFNITNFMVDANSDWLQQVFKQDA